MGGVFFCVWLTRHLRPETVLEAGGKAFKFGAELDTLAF